MRPLPTPEEGAAPEHGLGRLSARVAALRACTFLAGGLTSVVVARLLGPHDRGLWAVALLVGGLVALGSELGVGSAILYFSRREPGGDMSVATSGGLLVLATSSLAVVAASLAAWLGLLPFVAAVPAGALFAALIAGVPVNFTAVSRQALLAGGDLLGAAWSQTLQAGLVLLLTGGALIFVSRDVAIVLLAYLVAQVLVAVAAFLRLAHRGQVRRKPRVATMCALSTYGIQAHAGTVALFLAYRSDILLVNYFLGPASAGVYSVALTLSEVLRAIPEAGQMAIYARAAGDAQLPAVGSFTRMIVVATGAGSVLVAGLNYLLVPVVFGAAFAPASLAFVALVPGLAGLAVSYTVSPLLVLRGRIRATSAAAVAALVVMIALDLIVIPRWGIVGAAGASSIAYCLLATLQVRAIRRDVSLSVRELLPGRADGELVVSGLGLHLGRWRVRLKQRRS
jgi:antigen flippase